MKKLSMILALLFAFNAAYAAEGGDWRNYYQKLLKGLKSKVQKKFESKNRVSAVAAVRGARQGSDAEALYWKGGVSEKAREKLAEEKKALTEAVHRMVDGNAPEGEGGVDEFIKDNPESFYVPDAKEALANLPRTKKSLRRKKPNRPRRPRPKRDNKTGAIVVITIRPSALGGRPLSLFARHPVARRTRVNRQGWCSLWRRRGLSSPGPPVPA